jgi:hypothetical protein
VPTDRPEVRTSVERDLIQVSFDTEYRSLLTLIPEVRTSVKRDLIQWEKRPTPREVFSKQVTSDE